MAISLEQVWVAVISTTPKDRLPDWYDRKAVAQVRSWMTHSPKSAVKVLEGLCLADGITDIADVKAESEEEWNKIVERFWNELFRWLDSLDLIPTEYYERNAK
jgi:hypothetical protein